LEYVIRGAESQHPAIRGQFAAALKTALGRRLKGLATSEVIDRLIRFQATSVPF
jgi:hypothetical protein